MFVTECWYAAGFPDEFGRALVGRTFLGEPVVLFRTEAGELVALEDRCAHRRLPLSVGRLKGDTVECGYHGLVYDSSGACIKVPGQDDIPRTARLRRYPVADTHGYSWIWMGDPSRADPRSIPDYSRLTLPGLGRHRIALHVEANYQLIVDNLLDLSHLPYVHGTTTGNPPVSERASVKTERLGNTVQVKRCAENVEPAPTFVQFGGYQANVDIWQISQFQPPCYIRVSYGSGPTGTGIPQGEAIWEPGHWGFQVFHGITPETETTTHQFRYILHEKSSADAASIAEFYRQNDQIINEDRVIFAIQQKALSTTGDGASAADLKTSAIIKADGGLIQARAILASMLRSDRAGISSALRA
jgi:phenylpropionate dioxygenase-like ring-hydroxylating dioxygenase large terminal subunit